MMKYLILATLGVLLAAPATAAVFDGTDVDFEMSSPGGAVTGAASATIGSGIEFTTVPLGPNGASVSINISGTGAINFNFGTGFFTPTGASEITILLDFDGLTLTAGRVTQESFFSDLDQRIQVQGSIATITLSRISEIQTLSGDVIAFEVDGVATAVPLPSGLVLMLGGLGLGVALHRRTHALALGHNLLTFEPSSSTGATA